jgi:ribosomal protein S18 acetylase RimI-like enzyme
MSTYFYDEYSDVIYSEAGLDKTEHKSGFLVTNSQDLVGQLYFRYSLSDKYVRITNMSVDELHRRKGVASMLLDRILDDALKANHTVIAMVRETNLPAQLTLKNSGLVCVATLDKCYYDSEEAGYLMAFRPCDQSHIAIDHALNEILEGD